MKKSLIATAIVLVLVLVLMVTPAFAILWGEPDDGRHPYVGWAFYWDGVTTVEIDGVTYMLGWTCSGTLLEPTVYLTAGHCADGAVIAFVTFNEAVSGPFVTGTPIAHPDYGLDFPNTADVGVVLLDEPVVMSEYGLLPEVGALDGIDIARGKGEYPGFTIVGYGVNKTVPQPWYQYSNDVRTVAYPKLIELRSANTGGWNIHLSSNPGKGGGTGGACFGDSGGPAFIGDSSVIGGVGSFVLNQNCVGAGYYYRVDTQYAQDFIYQYLGN